MADATSVDPKPSRSPHDLIRRLSTHFDDESIQSALTAIENKENSLDGMDVFYLLRGRGARQRLAQIERGLKAEISLENLAILSEYLPRNEIAELTRLVAIPDETVIAQIKSGGSPSVELLPIEQQERIFTQLRALVRPEPTPDQVEILRFILDFGRCDEGIHPAHQDWLGIANDWCMQLAGEDTVQQVLSKLLWLAPTPEIIELAQWYLSKPEWTTETNYVLVGLMEATRQNQDKKWMQAWFEHPEEPRVDGWVLYNWLRTSNYSRRAVTYGKAALRYSHSGIIRFWTLRALTGSPHRKHITRWLNRFIRRRIHTSLLKLNIREILRISPTKQNCALAKRALQTADPEAAHKILLELAGHTDDREIIDAAKKQALDWPNAPDSFDLMCAIARSDSDTAVPWIAEWIKAALPIQVYDGLSAIVLASPTPENLKLALNLLSEIEESDVPIAEWHTANLLDVLLKVAPTTEIRARASTLLRTASDKTHPTLLRLANRLKRSPRDNHPNIRSSIF